MSAKKYISTNPTQPAQTPEEYRNGRYDLRYSADWEWYEKVDNPEEWEPCPRCGLRPKIHVFDNCRATMCGCMAAEDPYNPYSHFSINAESIASVVHRSHNGQGAKEEYERLYYRCVEVMQKLGEHASERKAIKHDRNRVDLCFKKFLEICAIQIPAERHIFIGVRDGNVHRSHAEKVLSDFHYKYPCLWDSYFRFDCIGPSGIEYEQPFFAYNEDKYNGDVVLQQQFRY